MKDGRIVGKLQALRELLDKGHINAIEFEAARIAVFRQAIKRESDDNPGRCEASPLDLPSS